jgi:hypothetical protein
MDTTKEFQVMKKAAKVSANDLRDIVVVVFRRAKGDFAFSAESNYYENDGQIVAKYLNGIPVKEE